MLKQTFIHHQNHQTLILGPLHRQRGETLKEHTKA